MGTVAFGKRQRVKFVNGGPLADWQAVQGPGIYAVTYKQDALARPKAHTVWFFGETADLALQAPIIKSDFRNCWEEQGRNHGELFIFYYHMPGSSQHERTSLQHQLVMEYDPRGNE